MTVYDIVLDYLKTHGYDGLFCSSANCHCTLKDLMPGEDCPEDCESGYLTGEGDDQRIVKDLLKGAQND